MKTLKTLSTISTKKTLKYLSFLAICFLIISCSSSEEDIPTTSTPPDTTVPPENPPVVTTPGVVAPDFSLKDVNGTTVQLSSFKGKVVTLFFLGNNCPFCKSAAPTIQAKLNVSYASRSDYAILGLDQWDGNVNAVKAFIASTAVTFPVLLTASPVAAQYKTTYDRLIVVDKNGNIALTGMRGASSDVDLAKAKVDELLK